MQGTEHHLNILIEPMMTNIWQILYININELDKEG